MEGFTRKLKKAAIYGATFFSMAKGYDALEKHNRNAHASFGDNTTEEVASDARKSNVEVGHSAHVTTVEYIPVKVEAKKHKLINIEDGSSIDPDNIELSSDEEKEWLLTYMESPEFREKALAEGLSIKEINGRIERLKNTPIFEHEKKTLTRGELGHMWDAAAPFGQKEFPIINVATQQPPEEVKSTKVHESQHASTLGNKYLSEKAVRLYQESFVGDKFKNYQTSRGKNFAEYLREATERDARKRQLEYEAEKMGLIHVGQVITEEDFKNIMDAYHQGKFTGGAREFIETTKPEYFLQIMNEIAENGSEDKVPDNLPVENQA